MDAKTEQVTQKVIPIRNSAENVILLGVKPSRICHNLKRSLIDFTIATSSPVLESAPLPTRDITFSGVDEQGDSHF
jgi:hypothetical protein